MKALKLNFHSFVDLITNSSTVIYTYSDSCIGPVKELINEFLKLSESDKTADDMFYFWVFLEDTDRYLGVEDDDGNFYISENGNLDELLDDILTGKIEKPDWMNEAEKSYDGFDLDTTLYIKAKDEKYSDLAEKLIKYLYSPGHEAGYDG